MRGAPRAAAARCIRTNCCRARQAENVIRGAAFQHACGCELRSSTHAPWTAGMNSICLSCASQVHRPLGMPRTTDSPHAHGVCTWVAVVHLEHWGTALCRQPPAGASPGPLSGRPCLLAAARHHCAALRVGAEAGAADRRCSYARRACCALGGCQPAGLAMCCWRVGLWLLQQTSLPRRGGGRHV